MTQARRKNCSAFSLMEMTVVLLVLSVVVGSGLGMYNDYHKVQNRDLTNERMDKIENALEQYVLSHHRLPCPANGTISESATNFGYEAALMGYCTGGTPAANTTSGNSAGGVVPTRTLQLPDEYMYDGWGRRFTYIVDVRMTAVNATIVYAVLDGGVGSITVNDAGGSARTSNAVYALISHGANGYGAYLQSGVNRNSGSTNTDERENVAITPTSSAFPTAFNGQVVSRAEMQNSAAGYNQFDDIVRYKERWNFIDGNDTSEESSYGGPDLLFGHVSPTSQKPFMEGFNVNSITGLSAYTGSLFAEGDDPPICATGISLTQDNKYLAIVHDGAPWLSTYLWTTKGFKKLPSSLTTLPSSIYSRTEWSPDGQYLAVANYSGSPKILFYKKDSTTGILTHISSDNTSGTMTDVAWDPTSTFVVFSNLDSGVRFVLFKVNHSTNTFTNLSGSTTYDVCNLTSQTACTTSGDQLPGVTYSVDWSTDGGRVAFAGAGGHASYIYTFNYGGSTTGTGRPFLLQQSSYYSSNTAQGTAVAFSPSGKYLIEASSDNKWALYKWNSSTQTYASLFDSTSSGATCSFGHQVDDMSFSMDERYVALGIDSTNKDWVGEIQEANSKMVCFSSTFVDTNVDLWSVKFKH